MASHNNHNLMLKVGVIKARNLAPKDKHKTSDPYLVLTLGEARHSTICIPKNLNPEWNETIELPVEDIHSLLLEVKCWDKDRFKKDYMGEFDIALEDIFVNGAVALEVSEQELYRTQPCADCRFSRGGMPCSLEDQGGRARLQQAKYYLNSLCTTLYT